MPRLADPTQSPPAAPHRPLESWSRSLDLDALAARFGTPLYVHHPATLRRNFADYVALVGEPGNVLYPVKANPSPVVVKALADWGAGADCASRAEVRRALGAGVPVERISYNTPAFEARLGTWLLRAGGTVVADSAEALQVIRNAVGEEEIAGRLFVRVNPGGLPGYRRHSEVQRYTAHGSGSSQFGIASEEVLELLRGFPVPVSGLHVHVGTQMDNVESFVAGLDFLHRLADLVREETEHPIGTLNLGGGLGIPHIEGQEFPSIAALAAALAPHLRSGFDYQVEPGNSLVGDSFALITRVTATKRARGRRWAIADVGTDQLVKHTVARWEHQIERADGRALPGEGPDGVAGPLCFAGDLLLPATRLDGVATGDLLLVRHAGAYCESIASHFNGRLGPPQAVVADDGSVRLASRREDQFFDPLLQRHQPASFAATPAGGTVTAEAVPRERVAALSVAALTVAALSSDYMHTLAAEDGYEIVAVESLGGHAYRFTVEPRAAVPFVAMPLAVRIIGDAAIIAVGLELGWEAKRAPVWATRLSLTANANLPVDGPLPCSIEVGALAPGHRPEVAAEGHVHFELGAGGEVRGVAQVSVPAG